MLGWVVRPLLLAAVVLALAGPRAAIIWHRDRATVVVAMDTSASISSADRTAELTMTQQILDERQGDDRVGVIAFDGVPTLLLPPGTARALPPLPSLQPDETDAAAAVRLAHGTLGPLPGLRRIVLLTDGRQTRGDLLQEVAAARDDGIAVDVVPVGSQGTYDAAIAPIAVAAPWVQPGEIIKGSVTVDATADGPLHVKLSRQDPGGASTILDQQVLAKAGQQLVLPFADPVPADETRAEYLYSAHVAAPRVERTLLNNDTATVVRIEGRTRVLLISEDTDAAQPLKAALTSAGLLADVRPIEQFPDDSLELGAFDAVILDDVPLRRPDEVADPDFPALGPAEQDRLSSYVGSLGGGLVAIGGSGALGEDYKDSSLQRVLPVDPAPDQVEDAQVALAIVLDRSGSMAAPSGDGSTTKIQLADEASIAAAKMLRDDDLFGLQACDETPVWHIPLQKRGDIADLDRRVMSIDAGGGGIYVYTSLADAYDKLTGVKAPVRHVILFSDAADAEEQVKGAFDEENPTDGPPGAPNATELARTADQAGITLSVVGIGLPTDPHVSFLRKLAAAGGGKFYLTNNGHELKAIFVNETRRVSGESERNEPTAVMQVAPSEALKGVDVSNAPPLGGYVVTKAKATAEVPLVAPRGEPILATWRYGLGEVATFTSDATSAWGKAWLDWHGYRVMWPQLVRYVARKQSQSLAQATVTIADGRGALRVDTSGDDDSSSDLALTARVFAVRSDGTSSAIDVPLEVVGPGVYRGAFDASGDAISYIARVLDPTGAPLAQASAEAPRSSEFNAAGPDTQVLQAAAQSGGGSYSPDLAMAFAPGGAESQRAAESLTPLFLALAALLIPVDILCRRRLARVR
jgi:uncharacterized membrane protein